MVAAAIPFVPAGATKAVKGAGKVINVVKGVDKAAEVGKAFNKVEDVVKIGEKTAGTSRAARREAMRDAGIPTSQQPVSQSKNASGRDYTYNTPGPYGATTKKSVQQQTLDRSHPGQKHWEAGSIKPDANIYGRYRLKNDKSKVSY